MATQQQPGVLLSIPAELRNAIYAQLLIQHVHHDQSQWTNNTSERRIAHRVHVSILATCKHINQEASPILYGQNIFSAHSTLLTAFPALLTAVYPQACRLSPVLLPRPLSMIRRYHFVVRLDVDPQYDKTKITKSFSGIEELQLQVFQAAYGSCDLSVLELFEDVRGVGKASITGSIGDGAYTTWLAAAMMLESRP